MPVVKTEIDEKLLRQIKAKAATEGRTIKEIGLALFQKWVVAKPKAEAK